MSQLAAFNAMTSASPHAILYVGPVWPGGTARARHDALVANGHRVEAFDTTPYLEEGSWLGRQFGHRLSRGPAPRRLNRDLIERAQRLRGNDWCVWVDKGLWIYPETLVKVRAILSAILVHYTPDPQIVFQRHKLAHFYAGIPLYDILFTTKPFEVDGYRQHGAKSIHLVNQSYDDRRLAPRELTLEQRRRLGAEVSFIGQHTEHYAKLLGAAVKTGARVRFWGPNWRRRLSAYPDLGDAFSGDGVWGEDYALALNATEIALCFLSKRYPETTTTRTFEIPGCGAFMLAERTDDHLALFTEGVEAEFFGDECELADKIRFYLANPDARRRIAAAGHRRALRSGYGDRPTMQSLMARIADWQRAKSPPKVGRSG